MRIFYTAIFAITLSSSIFAENKPMNAYIMELTKQAKDVNNVDKLYRFEILCINGYRYLFSNTGTIQMKENYKGKYRHMECPIKP